MPELKYLLYLGCVIPYRKSTLAYEISARKVLEKLGAEVVEMPEFNCCGLPVDPVSHDLMLTLAARNLCLAERENLNILTLCPGCSGTLHKVNKTLKEEEELREKINGYLKEIDMEFKGTIEVKHLIRALAEDIGFEKIKERIQKPLDKLRVAEHNGCHIMRPRREIGFDDPENPTIFKRLVEITGAKCLDYIGETECCGSTILAVNSKIPPQLAGEKLRHIKEVGPQTIITLCPSCHVMFDLNQPMIERALKETFRIPVLHYPQLLGLAMGIEPGELAFDSLRVSASEILSNL